MVARDYVEFVNVAESLNQINNGPHTATAFEAGQVVIAKDHYLFPLHFPACSLRRVSSKVCITEDYLAHRLCDVVDQVLTGSFPRSRLRERKLGGFYDRISIRTTENVAATFDRLGPFGHIAKRDIRNSEDRALFLN